MAPIDRTFVKKSFNASAATYDQQAGLQRRLTDKLLAFGTVKDMTPRRVLDIGMGTGHLTRRLHQLFPTSLVCGCDLAANMIRVARAGDVRLTAAGAHLVADAEALPFRAGSFDTVLSGFTYQWLDSWETAFAECRRVLVPGGHLVLAAFAAETFCELRAVFTRACREVGYDRGTALSLSLCPEGIRRDLLRGFSEVQVETMRVVEHYRDVGALMHAIKGMGARNASPQRFRTLGIRKVWRRMCTLYSDLYGETATGIPATYQIVFARAVRPPA